MFHVKHFLFNVERKWLHFLDLGDYNSLMATKPDTQPVPTPASALSTVNIRETLNPAPPKDAPREVIAEWGYIEAMLDGLLADHLDGELDPRTFVYIVCMAHNYDGCEWHRMDWDEDGLTNLQSMADVIIEMDYEV
jgi:hypothetical protein